jgi:hypothetical protein
MDTVLNAMAYGQKHVLKALVVLGGEKVDTIKSFVGGFESGKDLPRRRMQGSNVRWNTKLFSG